MRRFFLNVLIIAIVLVGASGGAQAQDAAPDATPIVLSDLLQRSIDALNAGDAAAVAALYTPDGTFEDVAAGAVAHGRTEIAAYFDKVFAGQTGAVLRPVAGHEGDGWAVVEYVFTVTNAESRARQEIRGATVYELENGLIRRATDYYALPPANQSR